MGRIKAVGNVTTEEAHEIYKLFMRRKALEELYLIADKLDSSLLTKLNNEKLSADENFQQWWNSMYEKYHWETTKDASWEIDFESCLIYLTD